MFERILDEKRRPFVGAVHLIGWTALWLCCWIGNSGFAIDPQKHLSQYVHRVWQEAEGLPQNSVQAICQGPRGFLWIATQEGLVRFDGMTFRVYDKATQPDLDNHDIRSVISDGQDALFFGNRAGSVFRFDGLGIKRINVPTNGAPVTALCWSNGTLWIGTLGGGAFSWTEGDRAGKHVAEVPSTVISSILVDRDGDVWFGTRDQLLLRMNESRTEVVTLAPHSTLTFEVSSLLQDRIGRLWVGTETSGLMRVSGDTLEVLDLGLKHAERSVAALLEDRDGGLWIATTGAGLLRLFEGRLSRFPAGHSLSHEILGSLFEDHEGNLWVGTLGGGLNQYADCSFTPYTAELGLANEVAWSVFPGDNGRLVIGTDRAEIYLFEDGRLSLFDPGLELSPMALVMGASIGSDGELWVATDRQGLIHVKDGKRQDFREDAFGSPFLVCFHRSRDGRLWIGTDGAGLAYVEAGEIRSVAGLEQRSVYTVADGFQSGLMVGTNEGVYEVGDDLSVRFIKPIGTVQVNALAVDGTGTLWVGTHEHGLIGWSQDTQVHLTVDNGFHDNSLFQILVDANDGLWFTSNRGVYSLSRQELDAYSAGQTNQVQMQHHTMVDGMKSLECNYLGGNSGYADEKGDLWVPTMKGLVKINPESRHLNPFPPVALIERVVFGEDRTLVRDGGKVPSGSSNFEFHFTCLSFRAPEAIQMRYRLLGYSDQWVEASRERVAYFSSLPHGTFVFEVEAINEDGFSSIESAKRTIIVAPPFYRQGWFTLLVGACVLLLLLAIDRLRARHHRLRRHEMEEEVKEKTKELDAIREEIVLINQQLAENARIAGMAEMATEVLHNIGNALNTATTSTTLLHQMLIDPTSVRVVTRIIKLIEEHHDDLATFLTRHEQGSKLPDVLARLAPILRAKKKDFLAELQLLKAQVGHMHEIIENQQNMEWAGRELEETDIPLLVENVVQMFAGGFSQENIEIVQDLKPLPKLRVFRSDFLQILTNLVKNAGESMLELPKNKVRRLMVKTYIRDDRAVVEVRDTGNGIPPRDIQRIFEFGYSTKTDGHGFGLHYCSRVIDRIGGILRAESAGRGLGASFFIELPLNGVGNRISIDGEAASVGV